MDFGLRGGYDLLIIAAGTGALKLGWTAGGALSGWLPSYYGYEANVAQSPETLQGLRAPMSWVPAVAAVVMWFYSIRAKTEHEMGIALAEPRAESAAAA